MTATILPAQSGPTPAQLVQPQIAKAWKSAQDFEAMALGELLGPMFDTVDSAHGLFGGGDGEATWRPMLTQELAKNITAAGGLGLAVPAFHQILLLQQTNPENTP
jgi:Rod binding domain-containing protein